MSDVFSTLRTKRLYLLVFCFFLWMGSAGVLFPHITPISVDYFAVTKGSGSLDGTCDSNVASIPQTRGQNATEPAHEEACRMGSRTAVSWVAGTAFFQNVLAFIVSPLVGWASDGLGRKPFFAASQLFSALPAVWIGLYLYYGGAMIPFPLYYVLDVFKGALSPLALVMSAVADVAEGHLRATIFSLLMLTMSIAMVIAAGLGGLLSASTASHVSVVGYTINLLLIVYALPETLSAETMQSVKRHRQDTSSSGTWLGKMVDGLKDTLSVLRRSELFAKLAVVMMVSGIVFECIQDLLFNYLIITMGFGASDNARILMTIGLCGLAVQERILMSAVVASTLEMAGFAIAPMLGPWAVYAAIIVGAPGSMAFPVISALKSVHAGAQEQGRVQGALFAARAIATGLGPLGFSAVFNMTTHPDHYAPSTAIWGLAVVMAIGAAVATTIRVPAVPAVEDGTEAAKAGKGESGGVDSGEEYAQLLGEAQGSPVAGPSVHKNSAGEARPRQSVERRSADSSGSARAMERGLSQ